MILDQKIYRDKVFANPAGINLIAESGGIELDLDIFVHRSFSLFIMEL